MSEILLKRHSLTSRLLVGLLFISIMPLAGLALLNLSDFEQALTKTVIANLATIADKKADQIDSYIDERRVDLRILSHSPEIHHIFTQLQIEYANGIENEAYRNVVSQADNFLTEVATGYDYYDMLLVNAAGDVIFSLKKNSDYRTNLRIGPYSKTMLAQGFQNSIGLLSTEFSPFDLYAPTGNKVVAFITTPLLDKGLPVGVLAAQMNLDVLQPVIQDRTGLTETGETVFAKQSTGLMMFTSRLHRQNKIDAFQAMPVENADLPMQRALHGGRGQGLTVDYAGHEVAAAWRYLPSLHWGMVVKADSEDVFAPLRQLRFHTAIELVALSVMAVAVAFYFGISIITPLHHFIGVVNEIAHGNFTKRVQLNRQDEIGELADAFNQMTDEIQKGRNLLEQTVTTRTAELIVAKNEAEIALKNFQQAQESLVQSEKLVALGGLVAGVAHEINTPVGVILMSATHLESETAKVNERYQAGELSGDELESYFDTAGQSARLITINSQRAADLIYSFKQVSVDQTSGERREFELKSYIDEVLLSLQPQLKRTALTTVSECPENIIVDSYPGALSQILTNLIINSVRHAYQPGEAGQLKIRVSLLSDDSVRLVYSDDGQGIPAELQSKIFDPFVTTQRGRGGSGLGLHIVYNIVRQTLKGKLQMHSAYAQGTVFTLQFPRICPRKGI